MITWGEKSTLSVFFFLLTLFVVSIVFFIFSGNILTSLIGWDLLGVTSYFLVVYYQNLKALNAGLLTVFTNRLGDLGILILLFPVLYTGPGSDLSNLSRKTRVENFLLIFCMRTKRAQLPFSA